MPTVEELIRAGTDRLQKAPLCYGHGSDNALDEAAELVFFAAGLQHEDARDAYGRSLSAQQVAVADQLINRRIEERIPAAYLTHRMWFCGHEFYVDERVLVPRSPIAELIQAQFAPWVEASEVRRALDVGTGSGCIAIAMALAMPGATVDAADVSIDALDVTRVNIDRHAVSDRVRAVRSDVFDSLGGARYELIVSNPPYVSAAEVAALPAEYEHEPQLGLIAGDDGLSVVRRILAQAEAHLSPSGVLVVEVGDTEDTVMQAYPRVPFTWLEFERGGGGVFVLTAKELAQYREHLQL